MRQRDGYHHPRTGWTARAPAPRPRLVVRHRRRKPGRNFTTEVGLSGQPWSHFRPPAAPLQFQGRQSPLGHFLAMAVQPRRTAAKADHPRAQSPISPWLTTMPSGADITNLLNPATAGNSQAVLNSRAMRKPYSATNPIRAEPASTRTCRRRGLEAARRRRSSRGHRSRRRRCIPLGTRSLGSTPVLLSLIHI